jgi:hypothetical protein
MAIPEGLAMISVQILVAILEIIELSTKRIRRGSRLSRLLIYTFHTLLKAEYPQKSISNVCYWAGIQR